MADPDPRSAAAGLLAQGEGIEVADRNQEIVPGVVLPDVVPIVAEGHTGKVGLFVNAWWIRLNLIARGVAGTGAQWFEFTGQMAGRHPTTAIVLLSLLSITTEERFSEQPVLTNIIRYAMTTYDPDAAARIFAPKEYDADPIGTLAKQATVEATKAFHDSPEYRLLREDLQRDAALQARKQAYLDAGMPETAAAVEVEIEAARKERAPEAAPEVEAAHPAAPPPPPEPLEVAPAPELEAAPTPEEKALRRAERDLKAGARLLAPKGRKAP